MTRFLYYFSIKTQKIEEFKVETVETPKYITIPNKPFFSDLGNPLPPSRFKKDILDKLQVGGVGYFLLSSTENINEFKKQLNYALYLKEKEYLDKAKEYNNLRKSLYSATEMKEDSFENMRIEDFIKEK